INSTESVSALSFAKPLDSLTKSVTEREKLAEIVKNENTIPVVGVLFDYNSKSISPLGAELLSDFVNLYNRVDSNNEVIIEGFTCRVGTQEYNLELSESRALSLEKELIRLGIDKDLIKIMPVGKSRYVALANSDNGL